MTTAREPQHPHGLIGYILTDKDRTDRALTVLKATRWPLIVVVLIVSAAVITLALLSPVSAAAVVGTTAAGTATTAVIRGHRRSRKR